MFVRISLLILLSVAPFAGSRQSPVAVAHIGGDPGVVDSARSEFEAGRTWHASKLLEPLYAAGSLAPDEVLLLARAQAGYRDWPGVVRTLGAVDWLDGVDDGAGWFVLGRAREALGDPAAAASAYEHLLARGESVEVPPEVVGVRLTRVLWAKGDTAASLEALAGISEPVLGSWAALTLLEQAVAAGRTARVEQLLTYVVESAVRDRAWDALPRSLLAAGDTGAAAIGYAEARTDATTPVRRARAARTIGDAARRDGDTAAALHAYRTVLSEASVGSADGAAAARWLVELDPDLDAATALSCARHLDRAGDGARALRAYDRHVARAAREDLDLSPGTRVERARIMATVPDRQEEAIREWRELSTHPDPEIGARALTLWAGLRRRQGRESDYATLRRWLVERYPSTAEAASVVFFRADAAHDQERWDDALAGYIEVARMAPEVDHAGLSRMRAGQIHLYRGDVDAARAAFEGYLDDFPTGRRWEEAAYWAARTRLLAGDSVAGRALLNRLRGEEPFSYYAVLTADLLGETYEVDLPAGPEAAVPTWILPALAQLDLLDAAGLHEGAGVFAGHLMDRAGAESTEALLGLAEGLNVRGRGLDGINLGWAARRQGVPWSQRLVRIVYPFPYQEMVLREAREVGVDPLLLAALIRQESAFVPDIVSSAGAVGLMQVMPATGRDLARSLGVENFTAETLESPEVNLHLGARFLADLLERYGPELPLALSAYNAGPARANRWKGFPEATDLVRFTERIPFTETRGYVKNVTRNQRLYGALYGAELSRTGR